MFAPSTPDGAVQAVHAMAGQAGRMLRVSLALAESGQRLDLAGLDDRIGRLVAGALDLGPHEGRHLRPLLLGLLDDLRRLEDAVISRAPPGIPPAA